MPAKRMVNTNKLLAFLTPSLWGLRPDSQWGGGEAGSRGCAPPTCDLEMASFFFPLGSLLKTPGRADIFTP